jgi:hypothetical protein
VASYLAYLVSFLTSGWSGSTPAPAPGTIVGLWPVRTLEQARTIQDGADAGYQPRLLSPELVSTSYAAAG